MAAVTEIAVEAQRKAAPGVAQVPTSLLADCLRALAMDAVERAQSGHPGMPMGMADVATVLFRGFLKFDREHPDWPDRDRFVLSAGHGSMLLFALLYLTAYSGMTLEDLRRFRQLGSRTAGQAAKIRPLSLPDMAQRYHQGELDPRIAFERAA